ncbi:MAG: CHAT domain-containing protein [Myxococcales bacterium]|nr:CHAT domain-containing protein [Myxococcales bacterium]
MPHQRRRAVVVGGPAGAWRAFLYAGAGAVIATRWDLSDRDGPPVMARLYRHLAAGASVGRALTLARRELVARRAPPRAWSAFELIGRADVAATLRPAVAPRSWRGLIAAALGVLGALAVVVGLRRRFATGG